MTLYINSGLSIKPSENAVFSGRFACFVFQHYVFSLVFALASRNKGNFISKCQTSFSAGNKLSAFESEIHPLHKVALGARGDFAPMYGVLP